MCQLGNCPLRLPKSASLLHGERHAFSLLPAHFGRSEAGGLPYVNQWHCHPVARYWCSGSLVSTYKVNISGLVQKTVFAPIVPYPSRTKYQSISKSPGLWGPIWLYQMESCVGCFHVLCTMIAHFSPFDAHDTLFPLRRSSNVPGRLGSSQLHADRPICSPMSSGRAIGMPGRIVGMA